MCAEQQTSPAPPPAAAPKPSRLYQYIGLAVMAIMVGLTVWNLLAPEENPLPVMRDANGWFLLAGLALVLTAIACEARTMQMLLRPLTGRRLGFRKAFAYANIDYYFSAVTPASLGGDPFTVYYMSRDGIEISRSSVMFLSLMIQYTAGLVALGGLAALAIPSVLLNARPAVLALYIFGVTINVIWIALSAFFLFSKKLVHRVGHALIRLGARLRLLKHPERQDEAFDRALNDYRAGAAYMRNNFRRMLQVFVICVLQRLSLMAVTWCVYMSFGLTGASFIEITAIQAIVTVSVSALPFPGAVGPAEQMFIWLFGSVFWEKLTPGLILSRGIAFYFTLVFSGIITLINHIGVKRRLYLEKRGKVDD